MAPYDVVVAVRGVMVTRGVMVAVRGMTDVVDALGPMTSYDVPTMLHRTVPAGAPGRLAGCGSPCRSRRARFGGADTGRLRTRRRRRLHHSGRRHVMRREGDMRGGGSGDDGAGGNTGGGEDGANAHVD